jgi:transposase
MLNAHIHHGNEMVELLGQYGILDFLTENHLLIVTGIHLVFLPPYSPDLNPIEKAFSKIKAWIQCNNNYSQLQQERI